MFWIPSKTALRAGQKMNRLDDALREGQQMCSANVEAATVEAWIFQNVIFQNVIFKNVIFQNVIFQIGFRKKKR